MRFEWVQRRRPASELVKRGRKMGQKDCAQLFIAHIFLPSSPRLSADRRDTFNVARRLSTDGTIALTLVD